MSGPLFNWPFRGLAANSYDLMLADPPWAVEMWGEDGYQKAPEAHYQTMSDEEIYSLPVMDLAAKHCFLIMWATWPKLATAMTCIGEWGFRYKTGGSWTKKTRHGKNAFGTGYVFRSATEPFLLATRGKPKTHSKSVRNLIEAERREHSRKPPEMREMALKIAGKKARCVELFAREEWPGHDVWGNQTEKFGVSA
jgi:N6-adenosine-specific RNA methylase IME4